MTIRAFTALTRRELLRWFRTPAAIVSSLLMPFFYLLLFGQALNIGKLVSAEHLSYAQAALVYQGAPNFYSYFSAGMVGFVLLFTSLFAGANLIFDKRLGFVKRVAASPVDRSIILGSRLAGGMIRGILLGVAVFAIAIGFAHLPGLAGLTVSGSPGVLGVAEILLAMMFLAAAFTSIFLALGFVIEKVDSYFAVMNLLNLPLLFTSNALFPRYLYPPWLQVISNWNPVSLAVDVIRENLFASSAYYPYPPLVYLGFLFVICAVLVSLAVVITGRTLAAR
ncbi:MAG: ABC transporter permease [Thermoplasmata archaeon]|nr:ABC transporter permease [Thermoplasmata archaeon]